MNKKYLLTVSVTLLGALGLSGCAGQMYQLNCTESSPKKDVKIDYGDSHLSVSVKEKTVHRDDYLVFELKPDMGIGPPPRRVDWKEQTVTITPKGQNQKWPSASDSFVKSGGRLEICVPSNLPEATYEYEIKVDKVGTLDPRVIVVPN